MKDETGFEVSDGVVMPASAILKRETRDRYGSVPGLDNEELASPEELERQVWENEFAPILVLAKPKQARAIRPDIDESGEVDWGAFGTIDFDRIRPEFDKARYRAEQLRRQLKGELIDISIFLEKAPRKAAHLVLRYLRMGVIDLDHIEDQNMLALAKCYLRSRRLRREIRQAEEASWRKRKTQAEAFRRSLD